MKLRGSRYFWRFHLEGGFQPVLGLGAVAWKSNNEVGLGVVVGCFALALSYTQPFRKAP